MKDFLSGMSWRQAFFCLLAAGLTAYFLGLGMQEIPSGDETRVAGISAEMAVGGDWLVPHLNGNPFLEYPPLYYWCQAASLRAFGFCPFAAKLPSAFSALAGLVVLLLTMKRLNCAPWTGLAATLFLLTCSQYYLYSHRTMVDIMLTAFVMLSVYGMLSVTQAVTFSGRFAYTLLFGIGLAGGIMTKGLVGVVIPLSAIGIWLIARDVMRRKFDFFAYLFAGLGTVLALALTGIWYYLLYRSRGYELFYQVFYVNNFGRFSGSQGDHVKPFWFYLAKLPEFFIPWMFLVPFGIWVAAKRAVREKMPDLILPILFLAVPFVLFSISAGKRQVYLLPLVGACAMLCGLLMREFARLWDTRLPERVRRFFAERGSSMYLGFCLVIGLGVGVFALLGAWLYAPLCIAALFLSFFFRRTKPYAATVLFCAATGLFLTTLEAGLANYMNEKYSLAPLFGTTCAEIESQGGEVVLLGADERTLGAAYYYRKRSVRIVPRDNPPPQRPGVSDYPG